VIGVPPRESDEVLGVQWELRGTVARRDQSLALGFLLNPRPDPGSFFVGTRTQHEH
jgi:hypothetical protein